jgi:ADP-ribose pyrophosphatase YjhB (NUDIX family)
VARARHRLLLLLAACGRFLLLALGRFRLVAHNPLPMGFIDGWKYCPRCASGLERTHEYVHCHSCGLRVYAQSQTGAEAVCFDGHGRVLLGRRAGPPRVGYWDFPGGFVREGELPLDAMRREVEEETHVAPKPVAFLGVWNEPYLDRTILCLCWIARVDGDVRAADDLTELRWFEPHEIPWQDLAFTHYEPALRLALGRQQDAERARLDP